MNDDDLRAKLTKALAENGVGPNGADMHSWRCSAYDDYCHCIPDLVGDLQAVVVEALAEAWDDGHAMATDEFVHSDYCGRVCQCEGIAGGKNPWRVSD